MADFLAAIVGGIGAGIGFALVSKAFNSMGKSSYPGRMKCQRCFNEILLPSSVFQWHCPCCNIVNPGNKQNKLCIQCGAGKPSHYKYYVICAHCSCRNEVPKNKFANSCNSTKASFKKLVKKEEKTQVEGQTNNNNTSHSNNNTTRNTTRNTTITSSIINNSNNNSTIQTAPVRNNNNALPPPPSAPPAGLNLLQGRHFTLGDSTTPPLTKSAPNDKNTKSLDNN
jgi:hypothetical protein